MSTRLLCIIEGVNVYQDDANRVYYTSHANIDADGANGQHGGQAAYMVGNAGSEDLANGGMGMKNGNVVGVTDWYDDIVILDGHGQPKVFPGGIIASKTAYRFRDMSASVPADYVDAETVPYVVVSPRVRNLAKGVVLGCQARVTNLKSGKSVQAVVADIGPRNKLGELSIAAARAIGLPHSPRVGGTEDRIIKYELFPGEHALVNEVLYELIPA